MVNFFESQQKFVFYYKRSCDFLYVKTNSNKNANIFQQVTVKSKDFTVLTEFQRM